MELRKYIDMSTIFQQKLGDIFVPFIAGVMEGSPIIESFAIDLGGVLIVSSFYQFFHFIIEPNFTIISEFLVIFFDCHPEVDPGVFLLHVYIRGRVRWMPTLTFWLKFYSSSSFLIYSYSPVSKFFILNTKGSSEFFSSSFSSSSFIQFRLYLLKIASVTSSLVGILYSFSSSESKYDESVRLSGSPCDYFFSMSVVLSI